MAARLADPEQITPELADAVRDELREFTRLGGFALHPGSTPWFGATLRTRAQAHEAVELAVTLSAGRCRGWLPGWPPRAGKPVCPPPVPVIRNGPG